VSPDRWIVCKHPERAGEWTLRRAVRHGFALSPHNNNPIRFARIELAQSRADSMNAQPAQQEQQP